MRWNEKEIQFLKENYSKNISLEEIANIINKTVKAVTRKAQRENLTRPRFYTSNLSLRTPKKIIDRTYYEKNRLEIYKRRNRKRRELKEEAVNLLGGKCLICGYNKCINALDFHHNGEKEKGIAVFLKNSSREKLLKEVKKCVLLCANCHREYHYKIVGA